MVGVVSEWRGRSASDGRSQRVAGEVSKWRGWSASGGGGQ